MNLIFDRTNDDLINDTDKAYIDYNDLNRIQDACNELSSLLHVNITSIEWTIDSFRTVNDMKVLHDNIQKLIDSYYKNPNSPKLPSVFTYESIIQANNIEECIYRVKEVYDSIQLGKPRLKITLGRKEVGNR